MANAWNVPLERQSLKERGVDSFKLELDRYLGALEMEVYEDIGRICRSLCVWMGDGFSGWCNAGLKSRMT